MTGLPAGFRFVDGLISEVPDRLDAGRVAPGFIDLQVNGGCGSDFTADPQSIWEVGERLPQTGVTTFLPTVVSSPYEVADMAIEVIRRGPPSGYRGAEAMGLHIEGPWISEEWKGAHNPEHLMTPDQQVAQHWAESGLVTMVTIAPELPGAFEAAETLAGAGVIVSAGHTGADFATAAAALAGPWSAVTHLFNQMSPFHHRAPGMVGAALLSNRPCGVIVDGLHIDPAAIRLAWETLGPSRFVLITDSMAATGLPPGRFRLGDQDVDVGPEGPRIWPGTLAGSTLTMDRAVANLVDWTPATVEQALTSASLTPATTVGAVERGKIEVGQRADLVVLDADQRVVETIIGGEVVYRSGD